MTILVTTVAFSIGGDFFGINYWYFDKLSPEEFEVVEGALKEIEVDTIRIGGLWYDAKGIRTWILEDFFKLCQDLDATPIVQIPLNGHSLEDMLSFTKKVRNIYKGRIIWSIGNEPDIYEKLNLRWLKKESLDESKRKYEEFLKNFQKGDDILILPDITSLWRDSKTVRDFLKFDPDVFSIHRYPFGQVKSESEILNDPVNFYKEIEELKKIMNVPIAITETNLSWDWNFHGRLSAEGELAGLWMVSIYTRSIVLNLWNVSMWSTVNDSALSLLMVKGGKVTKKPSFEFMRVFKDIPRRLSSYRLTEYVDWIKLDNTLIIVSRSKRPEKINVDGIEYNVPPLSVLRYDNGKMVFKRSVSGE